MKSFRILDHRTGFLAAAFVLLLSVVSPGFLSMQVSAAQLTGRSIALSSSAAGATAVKYNVAFTASGTAAGYTITFCDNSPLVGATCTAPSGFDASSVTTSTASTTVSSASANTVKVIQAVSAGAVTVELAGITNPTSANDSTHGFYARIISYASSTGAIATDTASSVSAHVDDGGVAMAITNKIGVSAAVLESMTFCVSGASIDASCSNANSTLPNLELGETTGSAKALSSAAISTGHIYTQISTNASGGAIVNLKSSASGCGGLVRVGGANGNCDIGPATVGGFSLGSAKFGVKTATASATSGYSAATGTLQAKSGSGYNASTYFMGFTAGDATGVTSIYGDPFLDTNSAPVNNMNMDLTFGASISDNTPAGLYRADLNLIASGTF